MSEHEISKHTKAIYKEWKNPHHSWKHKLVEILTEIFIIVFAITLSLLVERWREHAHERTIEKQFLIGLKKDLQADLAQEEEDSATYIVLKTAWTYFQKVGADSAVYNEDTFKKYQWTLLNNTTFLPNNSRFEALKSSGEIDVIENDSLQNLILDLYQNRIPALRLSGDIFSNFKNQQFIPYLWQNLPPNSDSKQVINLFKQPVMQNYLGYSSTAYQVTLLYHKLMQQSRDIIQMIDEEYELRE
jgi:hypothetical protein